MCRAEDKKSGMQLQSIIFFSSLKRPDQFWGPSTLPMASGSGVNLSELEADYSTYLLKMRVVILLPMRLKACTQETYHVQVDLPLTHQHR